MGLGEIIGFTILTFASAATGIIYALKHVKACKICGCSCQQDTVASVNDNDEIHSKFPSPLSTTKMFMRKKKEIAKPMAFMPTSTPRGVAPPTALSE